MTELEIHPHLKGFIPEGCHTLIMGTFPPFGYSGIKTNELFFYPSPQNHFWNRMENIFPSWNPKLKKTANRLEDVSHHQNRLDKENFAREKQIGFLDVFQSIRRKKIGSDDTDLLPQEDVVSNGYLLECLKNHQTIDRICCTYKLAYQTLLKNLPLEKLRIEEDQRSANGEMAVFNFGSRQVQIYLLYPATRSGQKNKVKDAQYKELIFRI